MSTNIKKAIHDITLNTLVPVVMGNPGDSDYEGVKDLLVERIHKTNGGWQFMGHTTKANGDHLLCLCTTGKDENAYQTTMASAYGDVSGRDRDAAIKSLGFSLD